MTVLGDLPPECRYPGLKLPTHLSLPRWYKTYGPEVADLNADAGFAPDAQQRLSLDAIFGRNETGMSVAFEAATVVGRQNMKTGLFKQCAIGWLFLFDERLVVWSAHEFTTSSEAFRDIETLVTNSDFLRREVKSISHGSGNEAITLLSGARLIFKTRTKGGGRGLSGRKVILDEAYALRPMHMGALLPTLSAQPDPQVLYGSAAGMADSDVLRDVRDRGRAGQDNMFYLEYCAPDPASACQAGNGCTHSKNAIGCGCDKPDFWLMANPTIGDRMTLEYVSAERKAMPTDEFGRERMGWWDDPLGGSTPIQMVDWYKRADRESRVSGNSKLALAFAVAPDSSMCSIAIGGLRDDDKPHLELVEHLPGTGWLIDRLMSIWDRSKPYVLVFDPASPAGAFEKQLRNLGFMTAAKDPEKELVLPDDKRLMLIAAGRDLQQACGNLANVVKNDGVRHVDQQSLNAAVEAGRAKETGKAWIWTGSGNADITPLEAITLANLGLSVYGGREELEPFFLT